MDRIHQNELRSVGSTIQQSRSKSNWFLALAIALVLTVIGSVALVWQVNKPVPPNNNVAVAPNSISGQNAARPDLSYPGVIKLNLNERDMFPSGRTAPYQGQTLDAAATTDNYLKVRDYFKQTLINAGYSYGGDSPVNCVSKGTSTVCDESRGLFAKKDGQTIMVNVYSPTAWTGRIATNIQVVNPMPASLLQQLKPDQTFILFYFGSEVITTTPTPTP